MPLVVEGRSKLGRCKRALRIARIVPERTTVLIITHGTSQRVVGGQVHVMEVTLAIADVHAIVTRTPTGGFIANAAQNWDACRDKRCIERTEEAAGKPGAAKRSEEHTSELQSRVDGDGFVFVQ